MTAVRDAFETALKAGGDLIKKPVVHLGTGEDLQTLVVSATPGTTRALEERFVQRYPLSWVKEHTYHYVVLSSDDYAGEVCELLRTAGLELTDSVVRHGYGDSVVIKKPYTVSGVTVPPGSSLQVHQGTFKEARNSTKRSKTEVALGELWVPTANTALGPTILLKRINVDVDRFADIYIVAKRTRGGVQHRLVTHWEHPAQEEDSRRELMTAGLALAADYDKEYGADLVSTPGYTEFLGHLVMANFFVCANQPRHFFIFLSLGLFSECAYPDGLHEDNERHRLR